MYKRDLKPVAKVLRTVELNKFYNPKAYRSQRNELRANEQIEQVNDFYRGIV